MLHITFAIENKCIQNKNSKHIVLLKTRKGEPFCSGSLLTTQHILTSGYCCRFHIFRNIIEVNAGFTKDNKIKQKAFAQKRYVHPTVNACVLELKTSIKFDEDIKISPVTTPSVFRKLLAKNVCRDSYAVGFILMDNTNEPGKQLLNQEACIEECPISLAECNDDKDALCNTLTDSKNCSNLTGGAAMCQGFQVGIIISNNETTAYIRIDRITSYFVNYFSNVNSVKSYLLYNQKFLQIVAVLILFIFQ